MHCGSRAGRFYLGDAMKLQQVLLNILSNAIKFTGEGGKVVFLPRCVKTRSGAMLRFVINDTGIGISEDFLQSIFEPFAQEFVGTTAPVRRYWSGSVHIKEHRGYDGRNDYYPVY